MLILSFLVFSYVFVPFIAPVAYKYGYVDIGKAINNLYELLCHQRVERSIFLFSSDSPIRFYSVGELKELKYLPDNPNDSRVWPEYYGHDFVGDSRVGYKVPLCIRDIALYLALALTLFIISISPTGFVRKLLNAKGIFLFAVLLVVPMVVDGLAQTVIERLVLSDVPMAYVNSISKRVVTGTLFGIGTGLLVAIFFERNSLTKTKEKGKIEV